MTSAIKGLWSSILLFILLLIAISFTIAYLDAKPPDLTNLQKSVDVPIELANGDSSSKKIGPQAPGWVPLREISDALIYAVIASEDTTFFSHQGFDLHEIKEAIKKDIEKQSYVRGASTLTQQLIKNVYLTKEKALWRKFKEILWARELERTLTKREILNFYLNLVEWGPGIYGIGEASRVYFQVPPSQLNAKQSAFLAMLLPSPKKYYSYFRKKALTDWSEKRIRQILKVMLKMKFIDEPTYESALAQPLWPDQIGSGALPLESDEELKLAPDEEVDPTSPDEIPDFPDVDTGDEGETTPFE